MFIENKYIEFYKKNKYVPTMFNPYNCQEITNISPTITTQCGSTTSSATVLILESEEDMDKLIQVGVLDGKKHEQSARIYSEDGICPTIMAGSRRTCTGGYVSPKILINTNNKLKYNESKGENMNRELINLKEVLGHDELLVAEFFKGYGSQSMSLDAIGVPNKVAVGSEIDADAIISYASARHTQEELNQEIDLSDDEIKEWLMARNIGWDFMKKKSSVPRMKKTKLHMLYNACILDNEVGDVSLIKPAELPNFDLMTYSFPCTDISVAGKQKGLKRGSGTRSGLLWECEKVIEVKKPKYLLMENVKQLVGKGCREDFDTWCEWLETQGYTNYWQVMNAKNYGVPQNRERVFMVSILGEHDTYEFPQKQELKLRLKDVLEDEVDEKYYIDNDASDKLIQALKEKGFRKDITGVSNSPRSREYHDFKEVSPTLCARDYKDPKIVIQQHPCDSTLNDPNVIEVANCITARYDSGIQNYKQVGVAICEEKIEPTRLGGLFDNETPHQAGSVWDKESVSPTLDTMQGGYRQPSIIVEGNFECEGWHDIDSRVYNCEGVSPTIETHNRGNYLENHTYRIRKLTPKECWRLMGVDDEVFEKVCESGISNSQLYKQAGNSIVRNCLDEIFLQLFFKNSNF